MIKRVLILLTIITNVMLCGAKATLTTTDQLSTVKSDEIFVLLSSNVLPLNTKCVAVVNNIDKNIKYKYAIDGLDIGEVKGNGVMILPEQQEEKEFVLEVYHENQNERVMDYSKVLTYKTEGGVKTNLES